MIHSYTYAKLIDSNFNLFFIIFNMKKNTNNIDDLKSFFSLFRIYVFHSFSIRERVVYVMSTYMPESRDQTQEKFSLSFYPFYTISLLSSLRINSLRS